MIKNYFFDKMIDISGKFFYKLKKKSVSINECNEIATERLQLNLYMVIKPNFTYKSKYIRSFNSVKQFCHRQN